MSFRVLGDPYGRYLGRSVGQGGNKGSIYSGQIATFEAGVTTPNPVGFDAVVVGGGGAVSVSNIAPLAGQYSFISTLAGAGSTGYGTLTGPTNEKELTLSFIMNISGLAMNNLTGFSMLYFISPGAGGLMAVVNLLAGAANRQLQVVARNNGGGFINNPNKVFAHMNTIGFKINLKSSTAPGRNDGFVHTYINGVIFDALDYLNNDTHNVTSIEIGGRAGVDAGTVGNLILDNIEWTNRII